MNINKIKQEIKNKKFTIEEAALKIGMTRTGLGQALSNESLKVRDLEKLCELLGVSASIFFDGEKHIATTIQNNGNGLGNTVQIALSDCEKELQHLREMIIEKDKRISLLERLLDKQ